MDSDMFMWPASPSGLRFRNHSLHSSIRNFLLLHDSETMSRELRLVRGMRAGKDAQGGAQRGERLAAELRGRPKPPA